MDLENETDALIMLGGFLQIPQASDYSVGELASWEEEAMEDDPMLNDWNAIMVLHLMQQEMSSSIEYATLAQIEEATYLSCLSNPADEELPKLCSPEDDIIIQAKSSKGLDPSSQNAEILESTNRTWMELCASLLERKIDQGEETLDAISTRFANPALSSQNPDLALPLLASDSSSQAESSCCTCSSSNQTQNSCSPVSSLFDDPDLISSSVSSAQEENWSSASVSSLHHPKLVSSSASTTDLPHVFTENSTAASKIHIPNFISDLGLAKLISASLDQIEKIRSISWPEKHHGIVESNKSISIESSSDKMKLEAKPCTPHSNSISISRMESSAAKKTKECSKIQPNSARIESLGKNKQIYLSASRSKTFDYYEQPAKKMKLVSSFDDIRPISEMKNSGIKACSSVALRKLEIKEAKILDVLPMNYRLPNQEKRKIAFPSYDYRNRKLSDSELIAALRKKRINPKFKHPAISDLDVYSEHPTDLLGDSSCRYFFCWTSYTGFKRPTRLRLTNNGCRWKQQGPIFPIKLNGMTAGHKTYLSYISLKRQRSPELSLCIHSYDRNRKARNFARFTMEEIALEEDRESERISLFKSCKPHPFPIICRVCSKFQTL